ncbi:hypothetical protein [Demequina globuliformis]|uniref:hypothetical protein n=1 Tax=Demequina globuliformis TaxID=676202 RepID=UPI0007863D18|nr:hypothetical protein [Demequina globuliformis]
MPTPQQSATRARPRVRPAVPTFQSAMGEGRAPLRMWVTDLTQRGMIVSDGEGAAIWPIDERSRHAVEQALAVGINALDVHDDGLVVIAGSEINLAPW